MTANKVAFDVRSAMFTGKPFVVLLPYSEYPYAEIGEYVRDWMLHEFELSLTHELCVQLVEHAVAAQGSFARTFASSLFQLFSIKMSANHKTFLGQQVSGIDTRRLILMEFAPLNPELGRRFYYNERSCLWSYEDRTAVPYIYAAHGAYGIRTFFINADETDNLEIPPATVVFVEKHEDVSTFIPSQDWKYGTTSRAFWFPHPEYNAIMACHSYGDLNDYQSLLCRKMFETFGIDSYSRYGWEFSSDHSEFYYRENFNIILLDEEAEKEARNYNLHIELDTETSLDILLSHNDHYAACEHCGDFRERGDMHRIYGTDEYLCYGCTNSGGYVWHKNGDVLLESEAVQIIDQYGNNKYLHKDDDVSDFDCEECACCGKILHISHLHRVYADHGGLYDFACPSCVRTAKENGTIVNCDRCSKLAYSSVVVEIEKEDATQNYCPDCAEAIE